MGTVSISLMLGQRCKFYLSHPDDLPSLSEPSPDHEVIACLSYMPRVPLHVMIWRDC